MPEAVTLRDAEEFMQPVSSIRRMPNGAIDYDFYRGQARALRSQAIESLFKREGPAVSRRRRPLAALWSRLLSLHPFAR